MEALRTLIIAAVALSLAVSSVSAVEIRASMVAGSSDMTAQAECCPHSEHCENQAKEGCGQSAACALKCSMLPGIPVITMDLPSLSNASPKLVALNERLQARLDHPPLPPPRV